MFGSKLLNMNVAVVLNQLATLSFKQGPSHLVPFSDIDRASGIFFIHQFINPHIY